MAGDAAEEEAGKALKVKLRRSRGCEELLQGAAREPCPHPGYRRSPASAPTP